MTFSIVGRCVRTGAFGVAITSSSPAVASRCAHARPGIGAVATQNVTDPSLGPALLDALESGLPGAAAIGSVVASATQAEFRQLTLVDAHGAREAFSGERSLGINGDLIGIHCVAAGNMLATIEVLAACTAAFDADTAPPLEERLLRALEEGLALGGEAGPLHSAGVLVVEEVSWPTTDLRVDWSDAPIDDLRALWTLWAPQKADYVTRALDPGGSPSYGVPGDDR